MAQKFDRYCFTDSRGRGVEISAPPGAAGSYHVYVNMYFYGQIVKTMGEGGEKWRAYPNNNLLPPAYWDKLVSWVEANEQQK